MIYAVVRIRSTINASKEVRDTLRMLNLKKTNSCTLIHANDSYKGMLQKVKDYVTWGEVDDEVILLLLKRANVEDAGTALSKLKEGSSLKEIADPCIRLHPPVKGYKNIKKPYHMGGSSGYRGKDINELIRRMI